MIMARGSCFRDLTKVKFQNAKPIDNIYALMPPKTDGAASKFMLLARVPF